jgi:diaminobutyrate-2-oxoglutarate transaminase
METAGPSDEVMKLMPPLTISDAELDEGLGVVADSVRAVTEGMSA